MINYFKNKMNLHVPTQSFTKTYIYWGYKDLKLSKTYDCSFQYQIQAFKKHIIFYTDLEKYKTFS